MSAICRLSAPQFVALLGAAAAERAATFGRVPPPPADGVQPDTPEAALRILARGAWGVPRRLGADGKHVPRDAIRVRGSVSIGVPGQSVTARLWLRVPPTVALELQGDLDLEARRFRGPIEFANWSIAGRVLARDARFESRLALERLRVANSLKLAPERQGTEMPRGVRPGVALDFLNAYAAGTVSLDGIACLGGIALKRMVVKGDLVMRRAYCRALAPQAAAALDADDLQVARTANLVQLEADGPITLERARIGGGLLLDDLRATCIPPDVPEDAAQRLPALSADHLSVGASASFQRGIIEGGVCMKRAYVAGSLDFSGSILGGNTSFSVHGRYVEDGLRLDGSSIDGDLIVNRQHHATEVGQILPTLIAGDLSIEQARIGGSLHVMCVTVNERMMFSGARVGRDALIAGLRGTPLTSSALGTHVASDADLSNVRIGGQLHFTGASIGGGLMMLALRAESVVAYAGNGADNSMPFTVGWRSRRQAAADPEPQPEDNLSLALAQVGVVEFHAVQVRNTLIAPALRVRGRLRMMSAIACPPEFAWRQTAVLLNAWSKRTRRLLRRLRTSIGKDLRHERAHTATDALRNACLQRWRHAARAVAPAPTFVPTTIAFGMILDELRCDGSVELPNVNVRRVPVPGADALPAIKLRNVRIAGDLTLDPLLPNERRLPGGEAAGRRAEIVGDVRILQGEIAGSLHLGGCRLRAGELQVKGAQVHGNLYLRDTEIERDASLVGVDVRGKLDLDGATLGAAVRVNNVRVGGDVVFTGTRCAGDCELSDSTVAQDVRFVSQGERPRAARSADMGNLRMTGNAIDGSIILANTLVRGAIDLSYTHAKRGLEVRCAPAGDCAGDAP